ncbi:tRNA1(Val) (adenine(37)-N6)-methyltransferase [Roseomonas fluvialis]|uniref:Methyltransferase n=1 Tax=Roseomonas fluvialis TaxID=1750527 RepID=A0ABM7Y136_9PROT|nr:methyltransferase domain-containing protein [Roseomonas fluvialis]BDG71522.1 methyltransferase [Roseomonas fluvialis]
MTATTEDRLLGGRVLLRQPADGFRAGLDAVLLAAFVPARPGARVLEAGCGTGAAFLCLAARVAGLDVVALERETAMAALARDNAAANGVAAQVIAGDVGDLATARGLLPCDHAFANPPYWPGGTPPPGAIRRAATHEDGAALADWARFLAARLRTGGTASLVLPAARFDAGAAALRAAGCGAITLLPVAPHEGQAAKRVLLRGRRGGRGPARILPPLVLHGADGGFTAAAQAVLRDAAALDD